jgi:hypothetical protein
MKPGIGVVIAGILLSAALQAAEPGRCQLSKNLYEERLTLAQKQEQAEGPATGSLLPPGSVTPGDKLKAINKEYLQFLTELSEEVAHKDNHALQSCCEQASNDRAGALLCGLTTYLNGGRTDSTGFLELFPTTRKETAMLWELDALTGDIGKTLYPPQGPTRRLIDELFLLVMDERDVAITKYFNVATHATGDTANYMQGQMKTFLKEAPSAVVNQWLLLRRFRPRLKSAAQAMIAGSTPAEMQKVVKAVRAFCDAGNPDCPDILKLYSGK